MGKIAEKGAHSHNRHASFALSSHQFSQSIGIITPSGMAKYGQGSSKVLAWRQSGYHVVGSFYYGMYPCS